MFSRGSIRLLALVLLYWLAVILVPRRGFAAEAGYASLPVIETPINLRTEATARRFVAVHGRRGMVVGYAAEALEGWVYPFRIFHSYRVSFQSEDASNAIDGLVFVCEVVVNP